MNRARLFLNKKGPAYLALLKAGKLRPVRCLFYAVIEIWWTSVFEGGKAHMFKPEQVGKRTRYTYAKINEVLRCRICWTFSVNRTNGSWRAVYKIFSTIFLRLKTIQVI